MEEAADLSVRRDRSRSGSSERDRNPFLASYSSDETIDLSTKRRITTEDDLRSQTSSLASSPTRESTEFSSARIRGSQSTVYSGDTQTTSRPLGGNRRSQPPRAARYTESYSMTDSSPDVIVLSDEERSRNDGHFNGFEHDSRPNSPDLIEWHAPATLKELTEEELKDRERQIRKLREELRNEEMKLVLLKKVRQSQMMKENIMAPTPAPPGGVPGKLPTQATMRGTGSTPPPPPLVRGSQGAPSSKLLNHPSQPASVMIPPLVKSVQLPQMMENRAPSLHPPSPSLILGPRVSSSSAIPANVMLQQSMLRPGGMGHLARSAVTTPPNVVMGYPVQNLSTAPSMPPTPQNMTTVQNQHQMPPSSSQVSSSPVCHSPQPSSHMNAEKDSQTPAQRQAAAKLALRKQLEKTLLQIPPPKPPPPEMHFIPNANNPEFVYLIGLESIVDFLTDSPNVNKPPPDPFECIQCGTDFTPVWKWQDSIEHDKSRPSVICEICVTSNIKKALKAEHTNRLKTAFVKALQQEQEIEQRMSQNVPSPPVAPPAVSTPPTQFVSSSPSIMTTIGQHATAPPAHSSMSTSMSRMSGGASAMSNSAAILQQMPKLTAAHQSLLQAQAQQLQHIAQSLPQHQPQPAHMLPFAPLLAAQAYSYQMLGKAPPPVTSSDLQRQYLLDMIPPRSLPQTGMNWKS